MSGSPVPAAAPSAPARRVLAVGAFERDNLGDILFYLLVRRLFARHHVRPAGAVFGDMRPYFGEVVLPYNHLLARHAWDVVIVVGGEIGAVDLDHAFRMVLEPRAERIFLDMPERAPARRFLASAAGNQMAYLPDLSAFEQNRDALYCVNSVGLSWLAQIGDHPFVAMSHAVLGQVHRLSVRDETTRAHLAAAGIEARLAPDCIHALARYFPDELAAPPAAGRPYLVFQMIGDLVGDWGHAPVAQALARVAVRHRLDVVFVASGTANHHDRYAHYLRLAALTRELAGGLDARVFFRRDALAIAAQVRGAALWVGTSLHGWVLSMSAGVPRVGLRNDKVAHYAGLWDGLFPADVGLDQLDDACARALATPEAERRDLAARVAGLAEDNIGHMFGDLL